MSSALTDAREPAPGVVVGQARSVADLAALIDPDRLPTAEQQAVIGAPLGPALVVAGAGSGKTETLSMRIVYLLDHAKELFGREISPDQILCLTFTRKAAAEIAERAEERVLRVFGNDPDRPEPTVATYNSYAAGLVKEHGLRVGVDPDSVVLSDASLWQLASQVVENWTADIESGAAVSTVTGAVHKLAAGLADHGASTADMAGLCNAIADSIEVMPSTASKPAGQATGTMLKEALVFRNRAALAPVIDEYVRRKVAGSYLDFADQVAVAGDLAKLSTVRAVERARYRVVLLDEFQDTSSGQLTLFSDVFGGDHPVMAVGDPHQAIYGFRGASASSLVGFIDRFGGARKVLQFSLSVSWRNEAGVLAVANAASAPLRGATRVDVKTLRSKGAELGRAEPERKRASVIAHFFKDLDAEAEGVVEHLLASRAELENTSRVVTGPVTAAILCRARRQIPAFVAALRERGVGYEVVGLGGLLDIPEVVDLVALLEVAHDPSRGDSLMRLLTSERVALGIVDLAALGDWSEELAGPHAERDVEPSIVDALEELPRAGWSSRNGRGISETARTRLMDLREVVAGVRSHTYLSLPDLVTFASRAWGLDIEAALGRAAAAPGRALDTFVEATRSFAASAERATLGAFLAWLAAAREEEGGLDAPVAEPDPQAIQIQTVHSAKGLEWDVVAIPGLVDGAFPKASVPTDKRPWHADVGWLSESGSVPWPLRQDSADLPQWPWEEAGTFADYRAILEDFRREAGTYRVAEERRLFYVAITRARSHVILSGAWWGDGLQPRRESPYVAELLESGLVNREAWAAQPANDDRREPQAQAAVSWPPALTDTQRSRRELAQEVRDAIAAGPRDTGLPLQMEIEAILREQARRAERVNEVEMPAHLSSTALVAIARDSDAFALSLRRPIPVEPTVAAQRGSAFHAWIEAHFGHSSLLAEEDFGPTGDDGLDLTELQETFLASPWAARTPTHVEVDVEVPVGPVTVRSRIDAVFPAGGGLDRETVVDWKSGRAPSDPAELASREVQLAAYRLAWSKWRGLEVEDVDAAFFYAASGETVVPERLLDEAEILALVARGS